MEHLCAELKAEAAGIARFLPMKDWERILNKSKYKHEGAYLYDDDSDEEDNEMQLVEQIKYWRNIIPNMRRTAAIYRTKKFKEELMMKAWHPDRVARWVDADRWDMLD
jgi:hypothetical protein